MYYCIHIFTPRASAGSSSLFLFTLSTKYPADRPVSPAVEVVRGLAAAAIVHCTVKGRWGAGVRRVSNNAKHF